MSLNRKIIYLEIDEEVNSVLGRLKKTKEKNIFLVIPSKAFLFQSVLNLKILKVKIEASSKKVIIVTKDNRGKKICQNVGFKVQPEVETTAPKYEIKIKAIDAYKNEVEEDTPRRKEKSKISITDLAGKISTKIKDKKEELKSASELYDFTFNKPNRKALFVIIAISIALFLFISYIALPGAVIYLEPKSDIVETAVNIELVDARVNQKVLEENPPSMVPTFSLETVFEKKIVFDAVSTVFEGTNAKGRIKIINTTGQEFTLKSKTRFQNSDGLIFRTTAWVTIPPRKAEDQPGIAYVDVEADEFDIYKEIIGSRGNIGPSKFIIPGLSQYNQKLIWGESEKNMQGGTTKWAKLVTQEDLQAAKQKVENQIMEMAKVNILDYVQRQNEINSTNFILLDDPRYIQKEVLEIRIPNDLIGQKMDQFEIYTKIKVSGIIYDQLKFKEILKRSLMAKVHPDMVLREINFDNIGYDVIDEDKVLKIIKISAMVDGREEYSFDPTTESGLKFSNKIKKAVLGMKIGEAENYLTNLKEVSQAEISTWPFFSTRIPGIAENIEVKIKD